MKKQLITSALTAVFLLPISIASHADDNRVQVSKLVSLQERADHRTALEGAKSADEKKAIKSEYRALIQKRADDQGVTLPEDFKLKDIEKSDKDVQVSKLVSVQERAAHRTALKEAKSPEERKAIKKEYRDLIQKRADEQGIELPEKKKAK